MKKICLIAQFSFDYLDGIEGGRGAGQQATWLPQIARAWEHQQDYEIHWCVIGHKESQRRTVDRWGQTFHLIPSPSVTVSMLLWRWPQRLAFRKLFRQIQPDLIHCWGTENLYGAALLEFQGPSILSMQGIITTYLKTGDLNEWRWKLFRHWEPSSIRKATVVTSESQWGIDQIEKIIPNKKTCKIEYGVDPSFHGIKWQPDPEIPSILYVGGMNRLKGIDILLEMLKRHPHRQWRMVFIGAGYLSDSFKKLNDPRVRVLGLLKTEEVQNEMERSWALVMPSRADTSPNVVKEARVIGLPVVGSPHGGHSEYVENEKDGFIVESENPDMWFSALDRLASSLPLCKRMGLKRHEEFRKYFKAGKTATQFLDLYRHTLR